VASIRTVIVTMPRMLSDIIAKLVEDRATLSVIARLRTRFDMQVRLPALAPDLVLIGLRVDEDDEIAAAALELVPDARVVALSIDGRAAYVHEMQVPRAALLEVSPAALVDVVLAPRCSEPARRV
jgi:DNA-binding NarL/FixJ family response regulator